MFWYAPHIPVKSGYFGLNSEKKRAEWAAAFDLPAPVMIIGIDLYTAVSK